MAEVDAADIPVTLHGQLLRRRPAYLAGAALMIGFQLALNRVDWLSKATIDGVFGPDPSSATRPALLMFVLALVAFAARVGSRWLLFNAGRDGEYELRAVLLHRLHRLGAAFYRKMSAGEIMARASGDLENVRLLLGFGVMTSMFAVFAFVSALQVMIGVSGRLTIVAVLIIPILVGSTRRLGRQLFIRAHAAGVMGGKLTEVVRSNLAGMRLVRTFGLERSEQARFEHANAAYRDAKLASSRAQGMIGPVAGAAGAAGLMAVFWYGASLLLRAPDDGGLTRGDFFAFWLAYGRLTMPIMAIGFSISIIQRGRASFSRLAQIFDEVPEVMDGPLAPPAAVVGGVEVRDLSFSYGDRAVVSGVSFRVAPGRSLAIVGRTGSGKSTVAMLLARLMPTPKGAVLLDGLDVCDLPLGVVRESVGYAQQEAFLFSSSVGDNVALGLDDRTRPGATERIHHAAREAHVYDEVQGLPRQFDTLVGERGVQLSGGQKQRVALARALVRGPKVLVLDDPLSAVDAKTEAAILDAIERQATARTVILVTHRVAAARRCDEIIVLDAGRIVDRGTHDELVARGGLYAAFASEQAAEGELDAMELDDLAPAPGGRS